MARYVVISFDDNEKAEHFIAGIPQVDDIKVVALIAKPTLFCETRGIGCTTGRVKPWSRGKKWGWWICNGCYKPCPPQGDTEQEKEENLMRHTVSQGVNLLQDAANKVATVFDRGWGALGRDR